MHLRPLVTEELHACIININAPTTLIHHLETLNPGHGTHGPDTPESSEDSDSWRSGHSQVAKHQVSQGGLNYHSKKGIEENSSLF